MPNGLSHYAGIPTIGITGTRGKTTTTMMVHELLKQSPWQPILLGGNISGTCMLSYLEHLHEVKHPCPDGAIILATSSL
jgi:UDP-N-acetylmuramoylalanine-D-glutamate ligase